MDIGKTLGRLGKELETLAAGGDLAAAIRLSRRVAAANEWALALEGNAHLAARRRAREEEFPSEDDAMGVDAWIRALAGGWSAGGFEEAQRLAPLDPWQRRRVARRLAEAGGDLPGAALAWHICPEPEFFHNYLAALHREGRNAAAEALMSVGGEQHPSESLKERIIARAGEETRAEAERFLDEAGQIPALWLELETLDAARLREIKIKALVSAQAQAIGASLAALKRGRRFPSWLRRLPWDSPLPASCA